MEFNAVNGFKTYKEHASTKRVVAGIIFGKQVYALFTTDDTFAQFLKADKTSDGENCVKFYIGSNLKRKALINRGALVIGTVDELEEKFDGKKNRGFRFEQLVAKFFGVEWEHDVKPFYERGDVTDKMGNEWLVKLETGTIITETTFNGLQGSYPCRWG